MIIFPEKKKNSDKLDAVPIWATESVINMKVNDGANEKQALAVPTIPKGRHGNPWYLPFL